MNLSTQNLNKFSMIVWLVLISCFTLSPAKADLLDLSEAPPYLGGNIQPNIIFTMDDSGSMDWEILVEDNWHFCAYEPDINGSFSSNDCGWFMDEKVVRSYGDGSYRYFEYIYDDGDHKYSSDCSGSERNSIEACPEAGTYDWRIFNSGFNVLYYNPTTEYEPWVGPCLNDGTQCQDASFNNVKSSPSEATAGYSVTRDLDGFEYFVWIDDKGFTGDRPSKGTNINASVGSNGLVDLWDTRIKFEFDGANIKVYTSISLPDATGMNSTETLVATLLPGICYDALGSNAMVLGLRDILNFTKINSSGCRTISEAKANVANWYEYARRREFAVKGIIGVTVEEFPNYRYGLTVINEHADLFVETPAAGADISAHNTALVNELYDFRVPPEGTPLRQGLERAGKYIAGNLTSHPTSPITNSCQQNFSILLTDGLWNGSAPGVGGDEDGDGHNATLADVARYYYKTDLSSLENNVPANPLDPATYQHMVTFMVAFGVKGALVDTDGDGWPDPVLDVDGDWGNPHSSDSAKIDDMWHGAFNSKGIFAAASYPDEILSQLSAMLQNIQERTSSASSVAQNSTTLQTNSQVYQARFNSVSWQGELLAYNIDLDGTISSTPAWNAGCVLTGGDCAAPSISASSNPGIDYNDRVIITREWSGAQQGIPFRWPSNYSTMTTGGLLSVAIENLMEDAPALVTSLLPAEITANQNYGQALVDYLRGQRINEERYNATYSFRDRDSLLADIIHSNPLYVGAPDRFYADDFESAAYSTFKTTYQNRDAVIYTGANDGMLHGFNASTGAEVLAYIPGTRDIYEKMASFAQNTYNHQYFVDGSPSEGDVFVNGAWQSMLAGTLGNGGQSIFALDITNPAAFTEANANDIYMFEFSDEDDADLGYTSGPITIAKVKHGSGSKWALIFGNGYNNTQADGYASTTGKAYLYILFIESGLDGTWSTGDYIKIAVGDADVTTPNGLASPYGIDIDGDYIIDYIYAGDLKGNLWKFDVTSSTSSTWASAVTKLYQTPSSNLQITSQVIVGPHSTGLSNGVMVYFGTGQYLENTDNDPTGATTQRFYGLWDKLDGTIPTDSTLLQQSITTEVSVDIDTDGDDVNDTTYDYRNVSDYAINWEAPSEAGDSAQHLGWYMDLMVSGASSNLGERQVFQAILRNSNVIFTTLLPSQSACDFGGDSWIMEVSADSGGRPDETIFDVNDDGEFSTADYILVPDIDGDGEDDYVPASGQKSQVGITPTPAVFTTTDKDTEVKVLSGSTGLDSILENPGTGPAGRQNWRQLQ